MRHGKQIGQIVPPRLNGLAHRGLGPGAQRPVLGVRPDQQGKLHLGQGREEAAHQRTLAALRRVPELEVKELDSGCCGMAGSFGYERGHYEVSQALANRVLIPAALADPAARLVAPGFSCRSQVHGLAGITAVHPIEILAEQLV